MALALALLLAAAPLSCALRTTSPSLLVLPPPRSITARGPPLPLTAPAASLEGNGASHPHVRLALSRFNARGRVFPASVRVTLGDTSVAPPSEASSYAYSLRVAPSGAVTVDAPGAFGAVYAFETLAQLIHGDSLVHSEVSIEDAPAFDWRGIMIDTGRRFFPLPVVYNLLDQMVAVKLNVLHLHASDECRWSVESKLYPNLTASLAGVLGGFYTQEDVKAVVAAAAARGIRVVPEFDIPSHSRGLRPIKAEGVLFCDDADTQSQVYADPANSTLGVLKALFAEMAGLFTDEVFHIGADETSADGPCTVESTFQLERTILNYLEGGLGKTAAGWEEVLFDASAATNKTVVYAWSRHTPQQIIDLGRRAVDSVSSDFYMTEPAAPYPGGWKSFWYDITTGVSPPSIPSLLGGEMSMWTDTYCYTAQCGAFHGSTPVGATLFPPEMDVPWGKSVGGMMFPRGYVGASSFWNFNASLDSQSPEFVAAVWDLNNRMVAAGALTCPTNCHCDQLTACGTPYAPPAPPTPPAANMSVGVAICALPVAPLQSFALGAGGALTTTGAGGAGLCVANPAGGSGNPTYPLRLAPAGSADCVAWARAVAGRLVDAASGGCLDVGEDGAAGIYECGSGSGLFQENQAWAADAALGAVVSLKDGTCITATA